MPPRNNNPYMDVPSNIAYDTATAYCDCCELTFAYHYVKGNHVKQTTCALCKQHNLNGTARERLSALVEHEPRLRAWIVTLHEKVEDVRKELADYMAGDDAKSEQVRSALKQRARWRSVAEAMLGEHGPTVEKGKCRCGEKYPCLTVRAAEHADANIVRDVERSLTARDVAEYARRNASDAGYAIGDALA